jgi:catechol 2,3-dioxygenase-like lactoylglutathione lyase family enzyme
MKIALNSVFVDDQDEALRFYTEVLGFVQQHDIPAGDYRWITVVSPEAPEGAALLLAPNNNPAARTYQQELFAQSIPATAFEVADVDSEHARLKARGVVFTREPTQAGRAKIAVFADTCGNLIQIYQSPA